MYEILDQANIESESGWTKCIWCVRVCVCARHTKKQITWRLWANVCYPTIYYYLNSTSFLYFAVVRWHKRPANLCVLWMNKNMHFRRFTISRQNSARIIFAFMWTLTAAHSHPFASKGSLFMCTNRSVQRKLIIRFKLTDYTFTMRLLLLFLSFVRGDTHTHTHMCRMPCALINRASFNVFIRDMHICAVADSCSKLTQTYWMRYFLWPSDLRKVLLSYGVVPICGERHRERERER